MVFSDEDKILIKNLYQLRGYKVLELTDKFSYKCWTKSSINRMLKKFGDTGTVNRLTGSGRPRSARTKENVDLVNDLVLSQEDTP